MTCKYLNKTKKRLRAVIGGSAFPRTREEPICTLGRQPAIIGWASRCEETSEQGPCWWWLRENGEVADPHF